MDLYVSYPGVLFGKDEVFVELKRNLVRKSDHDRLVGQIEALQPGKNSVLVVLCGETQPRLLDRLRERYRDFENELVGPDFAIVTA